MDSISLEFKKKFLLVFTNELINHSAKGELLNLEKIIESKEKGKKQVRFRRMPEKMNIPSIIPSVYTRPMEAVIPAEEKIINPFSKPAVKVVQEQAEPQQRPMQISQPYPPRPAAKSLLYIPEPKLPSHLDYLKPVAGSNAETDLLKLNPLIGDFGVKIIEVNPNERVRVTGTMGTRQTDIVLNREEIDEIIGIFSKASKIPTAQGVYRVVVGNLILSAIISEVTGSRFIIKKIPPTPPQTNKPAPNLIPKNMSDNMFRGY